MASTIGHLSPFKEGMKFAPWRERLEQYFKVNNIDNTKKVAALITLISEDTYETLRNLLAPESPADQNYDSLIRTLKQYFEPPQLVIAERYKFWTRSQKDGESISLYVSELKKLAATCEFTCCLDSSLRDRFVIGLRNEQIQKRLLSEVDLTLDRAIKIAQMLEAADTQGEALRSNRRSEAVNWNRVARPSQRTQTTRLPTPKAPFNRSSRPFQPCHGCGGPHLRSECPFRNAQCNKCGRTGHLQRVYKSSTTHNGPRRRLGTQHRDRRTYYLGEEDDANQSPNRINHLTYPLPDNSDHAARQPLWVYPLINGREVRFEIDSGTYWALVGKDTWTSIGSPKLEPSPTRVEAWTQESIQLSGMCFVNVVFHEKQLRLPLLVAKQNGPALFGRMWLSKFSLHDSLQELFRGKPESISTIQKAKDTSTKTSGIEQLLNEFSDVFEGNMGPVPGFQAKLYVDASATPRFFKARPVAYALKDKIDTELDRLETEGKISKVEFSDWATPIVPVRKPNGSVRICGDYKVSINPHMKVYKHPQPKAEDLFARLSGGKLFSKIDLADAFQQLVLDENGRKLTTLSTHRGLYQQNRLPFGVSSAPAIFQDFMDQVLVGVPGVCNLADDILVTGANMTEHLANLREVLTRLSKYNLRAKKTKCAFLQSSIDYLGHRIDDQGLHPLETKVTAIKMAPIPSNMSELRSFLGLVQYYSKFVPNISNFTEPLNQLLKKGSTWHLGPEQLRAIEDLKQAVTSDKVLIHYSPDLPLRLSCDASSVGVGAVISHVLPDASEKPIYFASRTLNSSERRYAQIEREALGIIFGIKKFRQYLLGRHFTLVTDHRPLTKIFGPTTGIPTLAADRLQRWALALSSFNYDIIFRPTEHHANADVLSRLPLPAQEHDYDEDGELSHILTMQSISNLPCTSEDVAHATAQDPILSRVMQFICKGLESLEAGNGSELRPYFNRKNELSCECGVLLWGYRVVIPQLLRPCILRELHSGHPGIVRMKLIARSHCWWPNIDKDIENTAKCCESCRENQKSPPQTSFSWTRPLGPWERVHVDFAGPVAGCMFLIVTDAFSKWPEVAALSTTTTQITVNFLRSLFARYGIPRKLVSDNGPQFTSEEFKNFLKSNAIDHVLTPPYHPKSNGEAERMVQSFKNAMYKAEVTPKTLSQAMDRFLFTYRNTPHASTGKAPAELLMGRKLRSLLDLLHPTQKVQRETSIEGKHNNSQKYKQGETVYVRNYREGPKWVKGQITKLVTPCIFLVSVNGMIWKRHKNQLGGHVIKKDQLPKAPSTKPQDWMWGSMQTQDQLRNNNGEVFFDADPWIQPVVQEIPAAERRYPGRRRKPVERLGL